MTLHVLGHHDTRAGVCRLQDYVWRLVRSTTNSTALTFPSPAP